MAMSCAIAVVMGVRRRLGNAVMIVGQAVDSSRTVGKSEGKGWSHTANGI